MPENELSFSRFIRGYWFDFVFFLFICFFQAAQQSYRESEGEKREEPNRAKNEEEKETGNVRREAEIDGEQLKMEEDFGDQNDKPEVRPRVVGVDRLDLQKKQRNIGRGDRGKNDLQNQDNQKNMMDEKDEERVNEEDDGDGLSRENMNRHEEKLDKSYHHKQAAKSQRQTNSRERDAGVGKVAPIPAVQRQDKAQKQGMLVVCASNFLPPSRSFHNSIEENTLIVYQNTWWK